MSSSTSSSEGQPSTPAREREARSFLVLFALCVLALEAWMGGRLPVQRGRHEVDRRVAQIERTQDVPHSVFLSDSISYEVLTGVGRPAGVLDLSSNQTIGVAGNYFLLRRLLQRLGPPAQGIDRVVYAFSPPSLASNLDSENFLSAYFETVFQRPEEIQDVALRLGRVDLVLSMGEARLRGLLELPTNRRAGLVRDPLASALRRWKRELRRDGVPSDRLTPEARRKIAEQQGLSGFSVSAVTQAYLPRLFDLCREHGIELVLVTAPVAPSIDRAWRESGYWTEVEAYLGERAGDAPGVRWIHPCPFQPQADSFFYDGVHLEQAAKDDWGRALLGVL